MTQDQINKRVEDALNSIDNIQSATLSPFFKTRVFSSLANKEQAETSGQFKPVLLIVVSVLLIVMNTILFTNISYNNNAEKNTDTSSLDQFSKDYSLNTFTNNPYDIK